MKIKSLLLAALALVLPAVAAAGGYPMTVVSVADASTGTADFDAPTNTWTLTCEVNDGASRFPAVRLNTLTEAVPEQYTSLCFEYRTTHEQPSMDLVAYKVFLGSATRIQTISVPLKADGEWHTFRADVTDFRKQASFRFLNKAGQYQDLRFTKLPAGGAIQLRNIRYDVNEFPFKDLTITPGATAVIEAEDFNLAADGKGGHSIRNNQLPEINTRYYHPTGKYFPIYAWGSVDYTGGMGDAAPEFLHQQYKELWECGFTMTMGTAWPGVDNAFLFDGQGINGVNVNLAEGTELKMICKAGLETPDDIANIVPNFKKSPRLAGYHIKDEPHRSDFQYAINKLNWVRQHDTEHMTYGNLLNITTDMAAIGFTSYDDYCHHWMRDVGVGFLSYDLYPVRQYIESGEIYLEPGFFHNLEIVSKLSKYYNTKFWAFAHSVASNCGKPGVKYPVPEEDHMRVQIFGNLAYGAQGLQYFTYKCPNPYGGYTYTDAPIDVNNQRTPQWYMVQRINKDVHALTWVYLGAEMLRVGHTNATAPEGCTKLTPEMLPAGVKSVNHGEGNPGLCVSMLQNGKNLFMMVFNGDIHKTQTATVVTTAAMKRVLMEGTTEDVAAGTYTHTLTPGHFALYLVSENEPELDLTAPTRYESSSYREDAAEVFIPADENASAGHYIAAMGDPSWDTYSGIIPVSGSRTITRDQAIENWGGKFAYSFEVSGDAGVDISIKHGVPFAEYSRVASTGVEPGHAYQLEGNPSFNWPKQYAAALTLEIDGVPVAPAQTARPVITSTDGSAFDSLLADKTRWTSTKEANGAASNVLYLWPRSSADTGTAPAYNDEPDYRNIRLTPGTHKITVTSLCYPWNFDAIRIAPTAYSGLESVGVDPQTIDTRVFNLMGIEMKGDLTPGIYIRGGKKFVVK